MKRLQDEFNVGGLALAWIESYLSNRFQFVKLGRHSSTTTKCDSGVPQGSVLGPLLFVIYVSPVGDVIDGLGMRHHQYADDTQLYIAVGSKITSNSMSLIENCTSAVQEWFLLNDLQLNPDKSEVLLLGSAAQRRVYTGES